MDIFKYREKHKIITYKVFDLGYDKLEVSTPVMFEGEVVAYYVEDGFNVISVPMRKVSEISDRYMWYLTCCLVSLNEDKDLEVLSNFLVLYLEKFCSYDSKFVPSVSKMRDKVDKAIDTLDVDKLYSKRKFHFVKPLLSKQRRTIIMKFINNRKTTDTLAKVENAIEWLMIEGGKFITPTIVMEALEGEYTRQTIHNYLQPLKEDIDKYNKKVFGTDNFAAYKKILSIHNINHAIEVLSAEQERLSRRKVADKAGVHFNTVQNLWREEVVQEQLDKFNQTVK